jgi:hypothetical protein
MSGIVLIYQYPNRQKAILEFTMVCDPVWFLNTNVLPPCVVVRLYQIVLPKLLPALRINIFVAIFGSGRGFCVRESAGMLVMSKTKMYILYLELSLDGGIKTG